MSLRCPAHGLARTLPGWPVRSSCGSSYVRTRVGLLSARSNVRLLHVAGTAARTADRAPTAYRAAATDRTTAQTAARADRASPDRTSPDRTGAAAASNPGSGG